ncbi:hypothetical protein Agub_g3447 [Astrephomene gubernaculifera]|uniref:Uncharacterized protein n=1 Tax=Astrephomene gubernaculifera TaxID=47775 RepID=A0AAD3DIN9_9CHLO|nr:hypothetical protein Agub_g3447 [Astrephomene gubernaculifera]
MAAAPTNLLLAQNFTAADLNNLGRANSPAIPGGPPPGGPAPNGLQFQTREEAQMFLQAAGRAQQNGANPGGIALTRDAVAALQHAAQVAAVNQAKMGPHAAAGTGANGNIRPPVPVVPQLGQGQNPALANLHTQAQLQVAMNAQRAAAAQAAAAQQSGGLTAANNQAALFLVQNQLAQAQAANNAAQVNPFGLQNGLQNNPIAAAAAAAAAVAATTQAAQARAAAVGNANLLQLQQAAQAAGLQRPQAMAWAQNQALQNAALAQHNLAQHNLAQQNLAAAQNNPALLAAALAQQAQQARAALQVQQLAQQQAAAAAAARPLAPSQPGNLQAQQLQVLRQLQARLNAAQNPNALASAAAVAPTAAAKPTEAQLQALRTALARSAAGRAALNAANVLGANNPRSAVPQAANGTGAAPPLNQLQQAINLQLLLQQQRNAVQVQQAQAQVNAMANNLANMQSNAAAALNGQLAALQQAAAANAAANGQRQMMAGNAAAALAGVGAPNTGSLNDVMLQNLQKMQLAKAMQDSAAAAVSGLSMPAADKVAQGGDAAAAAANNSSKEQRRLALACVALQLARGGMTVEQAINSGIMGGMSVTDVKFIVECYNAERQRMQNEGTPGTGGAPAAPQQPGAAPPGGAPPPQGLHGLPGGSVNAGGIPGFPGHLQGHVDLGMHGAGLGGMMAPPGMMGHPGMPPSQPPLPFAHSPSAPGSPAPSESKDPSVLAPGGGPSRMASGGIPSHISGPVSPPRAGGQDSPVPRGHSTRAGSEAEGAAHETRSEGGASSEIAADAAAAVAALAKEPFDAFSYAFFGPTEGPAMGELLGELETGAGLDGELEPNAVAPLDAEALEGDARLSGPSPLGALGELAPDQAAWLRAAASANQALWAGESAEEGPMSNDEIAARLANLDLGSGFF